jgi:DMSO/TMAO reductase YedYZ molybdopterin-dependent catalytic subunit
MTNPTELPPGQQLVAPGKWPNIGERQPAHLDEPWTLQISGLVENPVTYSLDELTELANTEITTDIHCVTRWSKLGVDFGGIFLADLLEKAKLLEGANFVSFQSRSSHGHSSSLSISDATQQGTLIALTVDQQPLGINHGGPIRNIVPGRYFYKSVKWLEGIEVLAEDQLGFWEADMGYHNAADPWKEQRYIAPSIDKRTAVKLIESRDFSDRDLRSIDASDREMPGLNANSALLRDANFCGANLAGADFTSANLSNAHFEKANLSGAKFIGADLEGANLSGADLRGADLTGTSLIGASFFQSEPEALHAQIDTTTTIEEHSLTPLTPDQIQFVKQCLQRK